MEPPCSRGNAEPTQRPITTHPQPTTIEVYPNPGTGREVQLFSTATSSSVALFSPTQALVFEGSFDGTSLSIPELGPGVYTGVVTSPRGQRSVFRYVRQ